MRNVDNINLNGNVVIPPSFEYCSGYSEGCAYVSKDGKFGFIDKQGKVVVPFQFDFITNLFIDGLYLIREKTKWGIIDKAGKVIVKPQFDSIKGLGRGDVFAAKINQKWGLINKEGETILEPKFYGIDVPFRLTKN